MKVQAPCKKCLSLWASGWPKNLNFEHTHELIVRIFRDNIQIDEEYFYPHPHCFNHHSLKFVQKKSFLPNSIFGPIKSCSLSSIDHLPFQLSTSILSDYRNNSDRPQIRGFGVSKEHGIAMIKSNMEAIERFSFFLPPRSQIYYDTLINKFYLEAKCILNAKIIKIPLNDVFPCRLMSRSIRRIDSTGLALHFKEQDALMAGMLELFERLLMSICWIKDSPNCYRLKSLPSEFTELFHVIQRMNYEVIIIPEDYGNSLFACGILLIPNANEEQKLISGSGAGWSRYDAIYKALEEVIGKLINYQSLRSKFCHNVACGKYYYNNERRIHTMLKEWGIYNSNKINYRDDISDFTFFKEKVSLKKNFVLGKIDRGNILTDSNKIFATHIISPSIRDETSKNYLYRSIPFPID